MKIGRLIVGLLIIVFALWFAWLFVMSSIFFRFFLIVGIIIISSYERKPSAVRETTTS